MKTPRVVVVGGYGLGSLSESVTRGFRQAGCEAELLPYDNWVPQLQGPSSIRGLGAINDLMAAVVRPALERLLLKTAVRLRPDLLVLVKCDELSGSLYRRLRRCTQARVFAFHPDDPFDMRTLFHRGPSHRHARTQMRLVDRYFVWSQALVGRARIEGSRARYLPFACDPLLHYPILVTDAERQAYGTDVCFVGNWDPERETWLSRVRGCNLAVWGNDYWVTRCRDAYVASRWRGRPLVGPEMAKAIVASKISLNILRIQNKNACNMRTFEIPACGGFMLHEGSAELRLLFRPGFECEDFASPEDLEAKTRHYLAHADERRRVSEQGLIAARRQTYRQWSERMLDEYERLEGER